MRGKLALHNNAVNSTPQWTAADAATRLRRTRIQRVRAGVIVVWAALKKVRWALLTLVVVLAAGTLLFWLNGTYPNPLLSLIYVLNLITLQAGPADFPAQPGWQLVSGALLFGGVVALAGGAARVIQLIGDHKEQQLALASTFSDHIIVCGIGRVGYRVIQELLGFGEQVVGVNLHENEEWLPVLPKAGVPIIIGDAQRPQTLIDAGIERASAIVVCTSNELTNLDVALDARELKPGIKVVLRMFDAKLAANVSKAFNIQTVFSVSALAAPAFAAAATKARVDYSFRLEGQLLNVSTVQFSAGSPFIGQSIHQIETDVNCSFVGMAAADGLRLNPDHGHIIQAGERFFIIGNLDALRQINNGQ
jgi:Trk K+ transport system NAD-binding subunit